MGDAYDDILFGAERGARFLVRRFLEQVSGVADALRAAGAALVMLPERHDLADVVPLEERAKAELAHAEGLARGVAAWPLYVGSGYASEVMHKLESDKGGALFGPPLGATPSRGRLAGYVLLGEGGALFYTAEGRMIHNMPDARDFVLELVRRAPLRRRRASPGASTCASAGALLPSYGFSYGPKANALLFAKGPARRSW